MVEAIEILMVEDNPADIRLAQECFKENKIANNLHIVKDHLELLEYLRRQGQAQRLDVVLVCLTKLLNQDCTALAEIKNDDALRHIPIVVLTAFAGEEATFSGDKTNIDLYITKPITLDQIRSIVLQIEGFWFSMAKVDFGEDPTPYATV